MDKFIVNVNAGGIFSKFMNVIQNINKTNINFDSVYINNIDDRSLIGDDNIFDSIFDQTKDESLPSITCVYQGGTYSKSFPIESSKNLGNYKKIINQLKFKSDLNDKIDYYLGKYKVDENYLGVHIRLCDMNIYHYRDYGILYYEDFLEAIKKEKGPNTKIFLASDNKESIEKLKQEFGDDLIYIEDFLRGETESEDTMELQLNNFKNKRLWEEAFIEMILLSKCSKLICRTSNLNNVSIIYSDTIKEVIRL
jgi:hypothetical protein